MRNKKEWQLIPDEFISIFFLHSHRGSFVFVIKTFEFFCSDVYNKNDGMNVYVRVGVFMCVLLTYEIPISIT